MNMKRLLIIPMLLMVALLAAAKGAEIKFTKTTHDFGNIRANGGRVSCEYEFTNTGDAPLILFSVSNGGCGCTTPTYPKSPIAPGKKGIIKITFDPSGRKGELNRTVMVKSNAKSKKEKLSFKGVILPK